MYDVSIPSFEQFNGFSMVYMRAIALCWTSESLWQEIASRRAELVRQARDLLSRPAKLARDERLKIAQELRDALRLQPEGDVPAASAKLLTEAMQLGIQEFLGILEFPIVLAQDAKKAFELYFNYQYPFAEDIQIQPTMRVSAGWDAQNKKWVNLQPNETILGLPEKPHLFSEVIALTAYIDSGPGYLFSCC